jgi:hypothetical protein
VQDEYLANVAACALSYVGTREVGNNRGVLIEKWQRYVGIKPGDPYCAGFACSMHGEAAPVGYVTALPPYASASKVWVWAMDNPELATLITSWIFVRPGDMFVMGATLAKARRIAAGGLASGHIGIAAERLGARRPGEIPTVEGNTDVGGSREGQGVYGPDDGRSRAMSDPLIVGWVRPLCVRSRSHGAVA